MTDDQRAVIATHRRAALEYCEAVDELKTTLNRTPAAFHRASECRAWMMTTLAALMKLTEPEPSASSVH